MASNLKMLPMWIVWYLFSESQDRENRTEVEQPSSEILSGILRGGLTLWNLIGLVNSSLLELNAISTWEKTVEIMKISGVSCYVTLCFLQGRWLIMVSSRMRVVGCLLSQDAWSWGRRWKLVDYFLTILFKAHCNLLRFHVDKKKHVRERHTIEILNHRILHMS